MLSSPHPSHPANHKAIFANIGCSTVDYPYYDPKTIGLDFQGFKSFLSDKVEEGAVVLLHACAHNPTGVDPTRDEWKEIAEIFKRRQLFAFFDCAYQGFAVSEGFLRDSLMLARFAAENAHSRLSGAMGTSHRFKEERLPREKDNH